MIPDPLDVPTTHRDRLAAEREQTARKRRLAGLTVLRMQHDRPWAETHDILRALGLAA